MAMKMTNKAKVLAIAALLIIAGGGITVGVVHAASTGSANHADGETNDDKTSTTQDNGKDGETNDDAKASSTATNTQDNGADGENAND
jgi:hypothetical protein